MEPPVRTVITLPPRKTAEELERMAVVYPERPHQGLSREELERQINALLYEKELRRGPNLRCHACGRMEYRYIPARGIGEKPPWLEAFGLCEGCGKDTMQRCHRPWDDVPGRCDTMAVAWVRRLAERRGGGVAGGARAGAE